MTIHYAVCACVFSYGDIDSNKIILLSYLAAAVQKSFFPISFFFGEIVHYIAISHESNAFQLVARGCLTGTKVTQSHFYNTNTE